MPTAFITYAHDTEEHKGKALALANRLRKNGIDVSIDAYNPHPAEGWPKWMEKQFASDYILVVVSVKYIRDFNQEIDNSSGGRYEGAILSAKLLRQGVNFSNIAIICFEEFRKVQIPDVLYGCTRYFPENEDEYDKLYSFLTKQPRISKPELGKIVSFSAVDTFKKLCTLILPLMEENRRIFEDFGPNSGTSKEEKQVRYDLSIWHSKRMQIVLNNREIKKLIDVGIKVIPEDHRDVFRKWRSHIDAFEVHVERDIDYREHRFPVNIVKIIEGNI